MPWDAQEGAKLEQNRSWKGVFLKLKRHSYNKLFLNAFLVVLGAPWGSKNDNFAMVRLKNQLFRKLHFDIVLRPVWEAFWGQVGPYKGAKWYVKVTSKLS